MCFYQSGIASDVKISGTVKDVQGNPLQGAAVVFSNGSETYTTTSNSDGTYQFSLLSTSISAKSEIDIFSNIPNPFSDHTYITVNAHAKGRLLFSVYNLMGQKIWATSQNIPSGIYYLQWNGTNQGGNAVQPGMYIYTVVFNGKMYSGKMVKSSASGSSIGSEYITDLSADFMQQKSQIISSTPQFFAKVSLQGFNNINHCSATIRKDTVINFTLFPYQELPFKTVGNNLAFWNDKTLTYDPIFLKGINLGTSPPGFFPGEIGYAIQADQYERWINRMGEMGFNALRIYTLHPPIFYEKLAQYNEAHTDKPLYLFQGIWLEEDTADSSHDLNQFSADFDRNIEETVNCMHGTLSIAERKGRAFGNYSMDISQWIMGYIIGREIAPKEIRITNKLHPSDIDFSGNKVSLLNAFPAETWLAARLDKLLTFETTTFHQERPVSVSSWPTVDPLRHPTEPSNTDEDTYSLDLSNINLQNAPGGYFASFHAYPYFPNFINEDPIYRTNSDVMGPNSYLGYLKDLKNHYANIPLVIAEYGVPSSWGSAHQSYSGMHHGGLTEEKQGEFDVRMLKNMKDVNIGGGMIFAWMDEWWKPTWIVDLLESKKFNDNGTIRSTKQLWLNVCSAEQNFGLVAFDPSGALDYSTYTLDVSNGFVSRIDAAADDHFFHLSIALSKDLINTDTLWVAFDTYRFGLGESILPNKTIIDNRAEFALQIPVSADTANFYVTQAYDEFGLTTIFNDADTLKQLFHSTTTDGAHWVLMRWKNNSNPDAIQSIGKIRMKNATSTDNFSNLHGVMVESGKITIRIPWSMLYVSDPTRLEIINGFLSYNEGWKHIPIHAITDGIAVSVVKGKNVINTTSRYTWTEWWNMLYNHAEREKDCVPIIIKGLQEINSTP